MNRQSIIVLFCVCVLTYTHVYSQELGPNLIVNPTFQRLGNCTGVNDITNACFEGWDAVSGTPNTSQTGNVLFIWSRYCDETSEAILGSLNSPLIPNKTYKMKITYMPYYQFPNYRGVVNKAYCQFTRSTVFVKADGSENNINIPTFGSTRLNSTASLSRLSSITSAGDSTIVSSNALTKTSSMMLTQENSITCTEPTAKFPDLVRINGQETDKVWQAQNLSDYSKWVTEEFEFIANEASTNFIFSILSNSSTTPHGITIKDIYIGELSCDNVVASIKIISQEYLCATKFSIDENYNTGGCSSVNYIWNFGNGIIKYEKNPLYVFPSIGTHIVSLTINYECNGCSGSVTVNEQITSSPPTQAIFVNQLIEVETDVKVQVITTSAVTFSDVWPLPHDNAALINKGSYLNGSQGIWRNNASYVYNVPRQLSPVTNVAKDGTFTLNQFDWATAPLNIVPNWIEANRMTKYSPYSYELENQDVLGVYSAALYDYGGHLPSANGVNMRHAEMGFTSFEYNDYYEPADQKGKPSGNWMLSNIAQSATIVYKVPIATAYMAVVDASLDELDIVQKVDVAANTLQSGLFFLTGRRLFNLLQDVPILCKQAHPTDPTKSIIVLERAPFDGLWTGSITVKRTALPAVAGNLDNQVAHSGKNSLKITTSQTFRQEMFQLEAGKAYWINAWVSVAQPNLPTPLLANGLGIEIALKNKQGIEVGKFVFEPVGTIIEGWQQVKGTFVSPIKNPLLEITFRPGTGGITAWYDDLRLQPEEGNMKAYVYDLNDYRLHAILDEENYGSFFYYDTEGNLYLTKKETEKGIKTISENISYQVEKH